MCVLFFCVFFLGGGGGGWGGVWSYVVFLSSAWKKSQIKEHVQIVFLSQEVALNLLRLDLVLDH